MTRQPRAKRRQEDRRPAAATCCPPSTSTSTPTPTSARGSGAAAGGSAVVRAQSPRGAPTDDTCPRRSSSPSLLRAACLHSVAAIIIEAAAAAVVVVVVVVVVATLRHHVAQPAAATQAAAALRVERSGLRRKPAWAGPCRAAAIRRSRVCVRVFLSTPTPPPRPAPPSLRASVIGRARHDTRGLLHGNSVGRAAASYKPRRLPPAERAAPTPANNAVRALRNPSWSRHVSPSVIGAAPAAAVEREAVTDEPLPVFHQPAVQHSAPRRAAPGAQWRTQIKQAGAVGAERAKFDKCPRNFCCLQCAAAAAAAASARGAGPARRLASKILGLSSAERASRVRARARETRAINWPTSVARTKFPNGSSAAGAQWRGRSPRGRPRRNGNYGGGGSQRRR
ncbi:Holliday junction resolvase MOC1, chloroplastic-like [Schistocerca americana]|uniref:Holliday junction resolvase MOC1, chloroplastic-like n=1 Tax=Schistocerca americana TaxID=7009 RepID=UPI001F4F3FB0|nr:Holliday junction resolvase MOC1, chloroplastic-like [Schistocerca americana]